MSIEKFAKNGRFVRMSNDELGVIVNEKIIYQNGGFDNIANVTENDVKAIYEANSFIGAKRNDDVIWYAKRDMPALETGIFVYVQFADETLGGWGVVVDGMIYYQSGGFDYCSYYDSKTGICICSNNNEITIVSNANEFNSAKDSKTWIWQASERNGQ